MYIDTVTQEKKVKRNRFDSLNRWQRLTLICSASAIAFTIFFALAEIAVRMRAWLKDGVPLIRVEDTYRYDEQLGLRVPTANYTSSRLTINSLGFRGPEIPQNKPKSTYRIAFLGGSSTFCIEVSSDRNTWPHLVVETLKPVRSGLRIDYINSGVPGYGARESRIRFDAKIKPLKPNLVVIYHAINDLSKNGTRIARLRGLHKENENYSIKWLSEWSMFIYLIEKNLRILELQSGVDNSSKSRQIPPSLLAMQFETDLRNLVKVVKESGAKVALVSFATKLQRNQNDEERRSSASTALYQMPFMTIDSILDAVDAYNQTIKKIADQEKTIFIDASTAIPGDDKHFTDTVHFTDKGARAMAKTISAGLVSEIRSKAAVNDF